MDISKLEQNYTIRAYDVDTKGTWRPSAILSRMQEIAEDHAILAGCGRKELVKNHGMAWMLTRLHLEMKRYPDLMDKIRVVTWPSKPTRLFFIRHTMFWDASGQELGRASCMWVLFDIKNRSLCRTDRISEDYPHDPALGSALSDPKKIKLPEHLDYQTSRTVSYSEVDMNCHLNNAKYADWICELFDLDILKQDFLRELRINFIAEAYMGQTVDLYRKDKDGISYICGKTEGKTVFDASVIWKQKEV